MVCERLASRIIPPGRRAHQAEERDGQHGDGDRGRHGQTHPQPEVGVGGAEEDAEDDPGHRGAKVNSTTDSSADGRGIMGSLPGRMDDGEGSTGGGVDVGWTERRQKDILRAWARTPGGNQNGPGTERSWLKSLPGWIRRRSRSGSG